MLFVLSLWIVNKFDKEKLPFILGTKLNNSTKVPFILWDARDIFFQTLPEVSHSLVKFVIQRIWCIMDVLYHKKRM